MSSTLLNFLAQSLNNNFMDTFNYHPQFFTIMVTVIALLHLFALDVYLSFHKFKHGVKDSEIVNDQNFQKINKIFKNATQELVLFLPLIWIFSLITSDNLTGLVGIAWLITRLNYDFSYFRHPQKVSWTMALDSLVILTLFIWIFIQLLIFT